MNGTLYLIPNTLGDSAPEHLPFVLPAEVRALALRLDYFVGENAKTTRAYLKQLGVTRPLQEIEIRELNVKTPADAVDALLGPLLDGRDAGLVSEAGCPAVADPGAALVRRAHERGLTVRPLVGPSSILLALMASGLDGQRFAFNGYLPTDAGERRRVLTELEGHSRRHRQTQVFIETPYRNAALFEALLADCQPTTRLSLAIDLTLAGETVASASVAEWRKRMSSGRIPDMKKRPTIFMLLAQ
ncbi:SAM-dependent methyltransferase [Chitinasiproducens palmae]|uniref:16S rRNA (Cytidine1402-2'-O)-methyltransferase n=1 Tax=Chitinasiproducens palmae TaxID=1770053 RepID=A0A1H2PUU0_9BURK|nr:SAM-dependent methyltransferase [Chitinasiproducens palmae]SDV50975.1 16S rRNA (cytidine1402-2'-O)-methyltransferase [Chitinasiproducens palmae]